MKYVYLIVSLLISSVGFAQPDLDFQTTDGGWTTHDLSKSYTGIGNPVTNVTVVMGGTTSGLQSNSPQAFSRGLQLAVNHTTNSACVTTTISFSPGVQGLTFRLLNIDRGAVNGALFDFIDQVSVSGKNVGGNVTPTISASGTAGTYSSISGSTITGTGDAPPSASDPGNKVLFADVVTEITITYCNNAAQVIANPGAQTITIEDLTWFAPLPVHLVDFQAKTVGSQVALNWETAWETNSDYFEVQRSHDAHEFSAVGRVTAVGQSDGKQTYSLLDQEPLAGTSYYRLKQVDKGDDQSIVYSQLIAVVLDKVTPSFSLVGNPVAGDFIRVALRNIDPLTLTLQSVTGAPIPVQLRRESDTRVILVPTQQLAPGLYLLGGQQGATRLTLKIIVL
ncbi:hypothetical protein [Spirosoma pollinicola]|uniref:Secretion system C-terminal sorting domain-containing protein n=1 Tax=Spirosoma pollinicola TaxID=2057025 RepID=A0A2K8YT69_9BACT|nr:hypothetical protein [Spirosoma pollinicola]AUD00774.1 hypothetical protein CWM47_02420 [Spirosoma pollinicola]